MRSWIVRVVAISLPLAGLLLSGTTPAQNTDTKRPTGIAAFETASPSVERLPGEAIAGKNNWTAIPLNTLTAATKGDLVVSNGRIAAVVRKAEAAVEVYGVRTDGAAYRYSLTLLSAQGEPADKLLSVALVENNKMAATLSTRFKTAKGAEIAAQFRIKRGDIAIQAEPGTVRVNAQAQPGVGAGKLRVNCDSRFVVLPDFFADDIMIDATRIPLTSLDKRPINSLELPSENFVMHMIGTGAGIRDAIVMPLFENRQQDVKVFLAGVGEKRIVTGSEIGFEGKKVWVSLLEAPGIWHAHDLQPGDTGKIVPLDWKMPFPAAYRVDFTRPNDLGDSWEMLLQDKNGGEYTKPSWLGAGEDRIDSNRKRWNTVLGTYPYPCWSDAERHGYLQPIKSKMLEFAGPVVVYPINRVKQTPLDAFTVVDVMRNTLGVGPCEHILDLEGQKAEYKGRATCSVRDKLTPIYDKNDQKAKRAEIDKTLEEGLAFVKHIRGRITRYVEFGQKMRQYLAEQRKTHPELAEFIDEMEKLTAEIDSRVAARVEKIKTPEYVAKMNDDFRKNVLDDTTAAAAKKCKEYTRALVEIGDNQDELSGECRWVVKSLRQQAAIRMALDPRAAPIAAEIRARTQEALRNPANHEGARH